MQIPKIIHRIWFGHPMPEEFKRNGELWKELHPDWEFIEWTDWTVLPSLKNQDLFDRAKEFYPKDWKRFRADLIRLEILDLHGGLYTDTDSTPLLPMEDLIGNAPWTAARSPQHVHGHHPIANGFIAAVPDHPFTKALIKDLPKSLRQYGHRTLARSIGPWHLTRTYEEGHWPDVTILGPRELYNSRWLKHSWNNAASAKGRGAK